MCRFAWRSGFLMRLAGSLKTGPAFVEPVRDITYRSGPVRFSLLSTHKEKVMDYTKETLDNIWGLPTPIADAHLALVMERDRARWEAELVRSERWNRVVRAVRSWRS